MDHPSPPPPPWLHPWLNRRIMLPTLVRRNRIVSFWMVFKMLQSKHRRGQRLLTHRAQVHCTPRTIPSPPWIHMMATTTRMARQSRRGGHGGDQIPMHEPREKLLVVSLPSHEWINRIDTRYARVCSLKHHATEKCGKNINAIVWTNYRALFLRKAWPIAPISQNLTTAYPILLWAKLIIKLDTVVRISTQNWFVSHKHMTVRVKNRTPHRPRMDGIPFPKSALHNNAAVTWRSRKVLFSTTSPPWPWWSWKCQSAAHVRRRAKNTQDANEVWSRVEDCDSRWKSRTPCSLDKM